uniref:2-oxoacid dehydrogenase acyltransferase catalytic domain-containing protein n=2 Tax=Phaeomonas parva TaxID=124430 RepID=A0A7S1XS18_9STRA|mmetsp:Transcript_31969/g.101770  ORF Transcript_31969/g.101770 Transcript_31969/m.101770 type:complete len:166 (+) Transcript_31969:114-611(+)
MKAVPEVNSEWRAADGVIRAYDRVDVNVFMNSAASGGTAAPCVTDAGGKGITAISADLSAASMSLATTGAVPAGMAGNGTFSMVNLGAFGVKAAAPIVNTPQAAILAVGAIENRLVPAEGPLGYEAAPVLSATVSFDHRVVDGAVGAQWLAAFKRLIEDPAAMLL